MTMNNAGAMDLLIDAGRRLAKIVRVHVSANTLRVKVRYYDANDGGHIERWVDIAEAQVPAPMRGVMGIYQYVAEAAARTKGDA